MPANRPPIPRELERRVLVESGHRCAIPTCRATPVDMAHIVPWATAREHTFDNLIALCPTCHRRYDRGEIDRQSMLEYKRSLRELAARYAVDEQRRRSQLIAAYCALRSALDAFDTAINGVVMSNVTTPGRKKEQRLVNECALAWQNAQLSHIQFAAASPTTTTELAERLLSSYKSFADDAVDGLLPSTHPGADTHEDIDYLEDEFLRTVAEDVGMAELALWKLARPEGELGGTGKRF